MQAQLKNQFLKLIMPQKYFTNLNMIHREFVCIFYTKEINFKTPELTIITAKSKFYFPSKTKRINLKTTGTEQKNRNCHRLVGSLFPLRR